MEKEVRDELLKTGNISLILDGYDDLFSDFDPRPYSVRSLSDDFLFECRKAIVSKEDKIELRFLVPKHLRNLSQESTIKKRLKDHFLRHFKEKNLELRKLKGEGAFWFILGAIVMTIGTILYDYSGFIFRFLMIISEPAGWFLFWEGLSKIFIHSKSIKPDFNFYKRMSEADVYFIDY
jgi:hypothetical protein